MNKRDKTRGYTDADLAEIDDSPELTAEQIKAAKPFGQAFPALAEARHRARGPQKAPTKVAVSVRLSADVVDHFRGTGRGWQTRVDEILRKAAGL